jgi:hypothetical protein
MKVSHEVPLALLEMSKSFNDYDYCLPHLLDKYEEYKKYFQWAKENNRYIIMDNSLHELGHAYDTDRLIHWINELQPDEFIVPDVWEDMEASIKNAAEWIRIALPPNILKVAVVQAKSIREAAECYFKYKTLGYKKIAFSYGAAYYKEHFPHPTPAVATAVGRVSVISKLYKEGVIKDTDNVHLLGCAIPQEFVHYKNMPFITTIDTSNPIMAAIEGTLYEPYGLDQKPKTKIDEVIDSKIDKVQFGKVIMNTKYFRTINGI